MCEGKRGGKDLLDKNRADQLENLSIFFNFIEFLLHLGVNGRRRGGKWWDNNLKDQAKDHFVFLELSLELCTLLTQIRKLWELITLKEGEKLWWKEVCGEGERWPFSSFWNSFTFASYAAVVTDITECKMCFRCLNGITVFVVATDPVNYLQIATWLGLWWLCSAASRSTICDSRTALRPAPRRSSLFERSVRIRSLFWSCFEVWLLLLLALPTISFLLIHRLPPWRYHLRSQIRWFRFVRVCINALPLDYLSTRRLTMDCVLHREEDGHE